MTNIETIEILVKISNAAYQTTPAATNIDGYELEDIDVDTGFLGTGFTAHAYYSASENKVIIAYAGTDPSIDINTLYDLSTDIELGLFPFSDQTAQAVEFANRVKAGLIAQGITDFETSYTGHSLGGHLAQYVGAQDPDAEVLVINTPGLGGIFTTPESNSNVTYLYSDPSTWGATGIVHNLGDLVSDNIIFLEDAEGHSLLSILAALNNGDTGISGQKYAEQIAKNYLDGNITLRDLTEISTAGDIIYDLLKVEFAKILPNDDVNPIDGNPILPANAGLGSTILDLLEEENRLAAEADRLEALDNLPTDVDDIGVDFGTTYIQLIDMVNTGFDGLKNLWEDAKAALDAAVNAANNDDPDYDSPADDGNQNGNLNPLLIYESDDPNWVVTSGQPIDNPFGYVNGTSSMPQTVDEAHDDGVGSGQSAEDPNVYIEPDEDIDYEYGGSGVPIIVDLNGDGAKLAQKGDSAFYFDMDDDGFLEKSAWADGQDGILVIDLDENGNAGGDGQISSVNEFSFAGAAWGNDATSDLAGLAATFDTNNDGVFNANDARWSEFGIWNDRNENGVVDGGELKDLAAYDITSIELQHNGNSITFDDGSVINGEFDIHLGDGGVMAAADAVFAYSQLGYKLDIENGVSTYIAEQATGDAAKLFATRDGFIANAVLTSEYNVAFGNEGDDNITYAGHSASGDDGITMYGLAGDDILQGGDGDDLIIGGAGRDVLKGGDGEDTMFADSRDDFANFDGGAGFDSIILTDSGTTFIDVSGINIEQVIAGDGRDYITAANNDNDIVLRGGGGNDVLTGSAFSDILTGDAGNDIVHGGGGGDLITGGDGIDELFGDAGDDEIAGGAGNDVIIGGSGADKIIGEDGADVIYGDQLSTTSFSEDGADIISAGAGVDIVYGGGGDDYIDGGLNDDNLFGGTGNDQLVGGEGNDELDGGLGDDVLFGGAGDDNLVGGEGNDQLMGDDGDDSLLGNASDYSLYGGNGQDSLSGGTGDDLLYGEAGDDFLEGAEGKDQLFGGDGHDNLVGGAGDDELFGGAGDDTLNGDDGADMLSGGDGANVLNGGLGNDIIYGGKDIDIIDGGADADIINAGAGDDIVYGGAGNDNIRGGAGDDQLFGNEGDDLLISGDGDNVLVGGAGDDDLRAADGADDLDGGEGDDVLSAGAGDDNLQGGAGNDLLIAGEGNDVLNGGAGLDVLIGNSGDDILISNGGNDYLDGGAGDDKYEISLNAESVIISDEEGQNKLLITDGFEAKDIRLEKSGDDLIIISRYNPTNSIQVVKQFGDANLTLQTIQFASGYEIDLQNLIFGTDASETIVGTDENDAIYALDGDDTVLGLDGDDVLDGGPGEDAIYGGKGNDIVNGSTEDDLLSGDEGDDIISGDKGNDLLIGGAGNDVFVATKNEDDQDVIADFEQGQDKIEVKQFGDQFVSVKQMQYFGDRIAVNGDDVDVSLEQGQNLKVENITELTDDDFIFDLTEIQSLTGSDINEIINGDAADNAIIDGRGFDIMTGGAGQDSFAISKQDGDIDTVTDFNVAEDKLNLSNITKFISHHQMNMEQRGDDTIIHLGTGQHLILENVDYSQLDDSNFIFDLNESVVSETAQGDDAIEAANLANYGAVNAGAGATGTTSYGAGTPSWQNSIYGGDGADSLSGDTGNNYISGGAGADSLWGDNGNDYIDGGWHNDTIYGGAGNDTIYGGSEDDYIDGGWHDDSIYGGSGNDTILGGSENDYIAGESGADTIYAGSGNDYVDGGLHNDVIYGGYGNDTILGGSEDDYINGEQDNDAIYGGSGNDTILGGTGSDYVTGEEGNDYIYGNSGNDTLFGDSGDDHIDGGDGNDYIDGGWHNDTIYGGAGSDILLGYSEDDYIDGGEDNDSIYGGSGLDIIYGGAGNDYIEGGAGVDTIFGGEGNDYVNGGSYADIIDGGTGDDYLDGGGHHDVISGRTGNDVLLGGLGNDKLYGGTGDDKIYGQDDDDYIKGESGNDYISGGAGEDEINGGYDDDQIFGDAGNDNLNGGLGNDQLNGGAGNDLLIGDDGNANVIGYKSQTQILGDGNYLWNQSAPLIGDFNGDGNSDIAFAYDDSVYGLVIKTKFGDESGDFTSQEQIFGDGNYLWNKGAPLVGDFNGDGRSDIAFAYDGGVYGLVIKTKFGDENGNFTSQEQIFGDGVGIWDQGSPLVGDFNGDNRSDIAFAFSNGASGLNIRTKFGDQYGNFTSKEQILGDGIGIWNKGTPLVGDFNGDNQSDIAFAFDGGTSGLNIRTKFGDENGNFNSTEQVVGDGNEIWNETAPLIGDFNGDGMSDIAFSFVDNDEGLTIKTKFSNGDGSYNSHEEFMGDGAGIWDDNVPLVADYNDDGVSDIAFVFSDADVGLQIRTKISNGDGGYSSSEQILGDAQEVWNNGGATVGDFNNDGKSDIVLVFDDINDGLTITTNQASNESKDILDGGSGHDQIYGGSDEDVILGGDGSDLISGGDGDDDIHGGSGVDYLIGETGADTFHFHNLEESSINALDVIADFDENNDKIDLSDLNIEYADLKFTINGEYTDITIENSDFAFRLLGNDHELTEQQFTV